MIVCSTSDDKLERMRALGAAETINVAREDFRSRVRELTGRTGPDVIVDYQGEETWPDTIKSVGFRGRILICGATTGFNATTDLRYLFGREAEIIGCAGWTREDLETLLGLVRSGEIDPPIHGAYALSDVRDAVAELEERRAFGKVVVIPDGAA
jgi:NADPH:quinone reductase-like Zn-dependent oxidoreductase